jgi:WD40 repeat protein
VADLGLRTAQPCVVPDGPQGGDNGKVKYWQLNMNQVFEFQAHQDTVLRELSYVSLFTKCSAVLSFLLASSFALNAEPCVAECVCSIAPTDAKFATGGDDSTVRIFDFKLPDKEERLLRGLSIGRLCYRNSPRVSQWSSDALQGMAMRCARWPGTHTRA